MSFDFTAFSNEIFDKIMREEAARERAFMFDARPVTYTFKKAGHNDSPYYNENTIVGEVVEDDRSTNGTGRELRSSESSDIP